MAEWLTPILVVVLGGVFSAVGWRYRQSFERRWKLVEQRRKQDEQLNPDRIAVYNEILEPFIVVLMSDLAWLDIQANQSELRGKSKYDVALTKVYSLDYKRSSFKLMLIGTDEVVRAYNDLMRLFYDRGESMTDADWVDALELFGELVLTIRRSVGNDATQLDAWDMLFWGWSNIEQIRADYRS